MMNAEDIVKELEKQFIGEKLYSQEDILDELICCGCDITNIDLTCDNSNREYSFYFYDNETDVSYVVVMDDCKYVVSIYGE